MENRHIFGPFGQSLKPMLIALVVCCAWTNIAGAGGFTGGLNIGSNISVPITDLTLYPKTPEWLSITQYDLVGGSWPSGTGTWSTSSNRAWYYDVANGNASKNKVSNYTAVTIPTPKKTGYEFSTWVWTRPDFRLIEREEGTFGGHVKYTMVYKECASGPKFYGKVGVVDGICCDPEYLPSDAMTYGWALFCSDKLTSGVKLTAIWEPVKKEIYLKNGTSTLATIYTKYDTGVYKQSNYTEELTPSGSYVVDKPNPSSWTVGYNSHGGGTFSSVTKSFKGYYNSTATDATQYIDANRKITADGQERAVSILADEKWYAKWNNSTTKLPTPSKNGYDFTGWYKAATGNDKVGGANDSYSITEDITLHAHWNAHTYKIKFNKNDTSANGSMSDLSMTYDVSANLTQNAFTKTGYVFGGWCKEESGSDCTKKYDDGANVKNLTAKNNEVVNLYAKWNLGVYGFDLKVNTTKTLSTTPTSKIYEKYNTGWYKNAEATSARQIKSETGEIVVPKIRDNNVADFDGYYVCQAATGASNCKQIINKNGFLSQNYVKNLSSDGELYARWNTVPGMFIRGNTTTATNCTQGSWCPGGENLNISDADDRGLNSCAETTGNSFLYSPASTSDVTGCYAKLTLNGNGGVTPGNLSSIEVQAFYGGDSCTYNDVNLCTSSLSTDNEHYTYSLISNVAGKTIFTNGDKAFAGWYDQPEGGNKITSATQLSGDRTLYAQWEDVGIVYEFMDGTNGKYTYTTRDVGTDVPNPTRDGYIFAGWCLDTDYQVDADDNVTCADRVITTESPNKNLLNMKVPNVSVNTTYKALWEPDKFQMDIIDIDATSENDKYFAFLLGAKGTFLVDWGDGIVELIDTDNPSVPTYDNIFGAPYSHTYASSGNYKIHFGGNATGRAGYETFITFGSSWTTTSSANANEGIMVRSENTRNKIKKINGSLSSLFGITTAEFHAFYETFKGCANLTTISENLFSGITTAGNYAFRATFSGCTSLTTIPGDLFSNITSAGGVAFGDTFSGCTNLTTIPSDLFSNITTAGDYAFRNTFSDCTKLATIPNNLFGKITTAGEFAFYKTFKGCTGLTQLPNTLFKSNVPKVEPSSDMFREMFSGCTGLTGYVPATLFAPFNDTNYVADTAMGGVFNGDKHLATKCADGWKEIKINFRKDWCINNICMPEEVPVDVLEPDNTIFVPCLDLGSESESCAPYTDGIEEDYAISCELGVWDITLYDGDDEPLTHIYEKFGVGFYSTESGAEDEDESEIITSITPPTRDDYVFEGYYNGDKQIFTSTGAFVETITEPAKEFKTDTTLTAKWVYGCPYGQKPNADNNGCVCDGDVGYISDQVDESVCVCDAVNGYGLDSGSGICVQNCTPDYPSYDETENKCYKEDDTTILPCSCGEGVDTCTFAGGADTTSCRIYVGSDECVDYMGNCVVISVVCGAGYDVQSNNKCEKCSTGYYCPGNNQDPQSCPPGMTSPAGSQSEYDCGTVFHVGDKIMYLHQYEGRPANEAVLVIKSGDDKYYANLTDEDGGKVMTKGSDAKLHITVGSKDYTAYDNSVSYYGE